MNFMIRIRTLPIDTTRKDAKYAEEITTQQRNVFLKGEKLIRELLEISTQEEEVINQDIEDLTTDTRTEKGLDIREITTTTEGRAGRYDRYDGKAGYQKREYRKQQS
ncbi:hypothetical protein RhiirA5_375589 [Rhizophagus irregularis]|uniref:Uncharacterized protein n=2 Tax=Rhizophagus irregularis TaxID=588596 RepID=A0A2I1E8M7_9GLOM|nr:hypothetical protein RhiirA5_375589 [Rhizophagus irregularis]PKC63574.1 hypothetical protein RhiirA1_463552 [Rhizophagus irregularis]PKY18451.1 hypothetical protein RhiirB3_431265 [Rhizophagus irregularis]CAB4470857.1 unnamed protein product [Rhizophagus irregularis]